MNTVKCEKPEFTEEMRAKLNKMYKLLKDRFYSKQELMQIFGLGERQIRMIITEISHRFPVISTSGTNAGYKIATSEADLELVEHTWGELSSRLTEIEKRIEPLIKFRDKVRGY
jgi:biotin operon repressor